MDPRSTLSRNSSSNIPQASYNPNMTSAYAMPPYGNNTHLPPINYHPPPQLPQSNQNYMPSQYRNELPRYNPAPSPVQNPDNRYNPNPAQGSMNNFQGGSVLPQPHAQNQQQQQSQQQQPQQQQQQQQQQYGNPGAGRPSYPQPLAPAPPRPNLNPFAGGYGQPGDNREIGWASNETMPSLSGDVGRDPTRTHVVGSQGRRGILPSAPGRPPVMTNGMNGSPKSNAIPQKDADGKFPCPNCTKTYLHAKHLKRHMLRHTGDRPYMCVLCNDTFSRSDILKRHFQKCSVRRGNPTGASHLSNPAAHLKKSQAAAAKAAATASPASATTPNSSSGMPTGPYTTTSMAGSSLPATSGSMSVPNISYAMATNGQNEMQRPGQNQSMQGSAEQGGLDPNAQKNWQMHGGRGGLMYSPNSSTPDHHFGMPAGNEENKANVMPGNHHVNDQWGNQIPSFATNDQYMNQMFTGYDQNHNDGKKGYAQHEGGSTGYYIPPTSLGADGTLDPPSWNFLESSHADPLQNKVDHLVDFCLPLGIQESLQEQQNNFYLRSCLNVDAIKHFVQLYSNYQGHFPWLHIPTFNFANAYDGLILAIICAGAVYSDRISQSQVRSLIIKVKQGIQRRSQLWHRFVNGLSLSASSSRHSDYEELQAILMCQNLIMWHGGPEGRSAARAESRKVSQLVREMDMMTLAPQGDSAFSYLHNLIPGEQADPSRWSWRSWLEQEKRSRLMFMAYLSDAALTLYFNCPPVFQASEVKLPLPCDDAAWDAADAETCAKALGLRGSTSQSQINLSGSLRLKQLEMHHAVAALHNHNITIQPRTTNVYGKFILVHAIHVQIWQLQQQRSYNTPGNSPTPNDSPLPFGNNMAKSLNLALTKWKYSWDGDLSLQYPPSSSVPSSSKRHGFCRDGIQFYWLARALLQPNRMHDWQLPSEARFRQVMHALRQAKAWSNTDGAQRGEEPGSVADIDDNYETEADELDMRKLMRPLDTLYSSPPPYSQAGFNEYDR